MRYRFLADALVVVHLAFILFAVFGGLLALWKRWWVALHVPAAAWAVWIEWSGAICPLTPWEQTLLQRGGEAGYGGGFIEHYLIPLIYPAVLTPTLQLALGIFVLVVNAAIYATVWRRWHRHRRPLSRPQA